MWKLVFVAAALAVSAIPLDAAPQEGKRSEKSERTAELRRDVERIAKEIYPPRSDLDSGRKSLAAGAAVKKR